MSIDKKQLEINVNLFALEPNFLNYELHYVIASDEKTFRFANWDDEPKSGEKKYYCFLTEEPLQIPAGDIKLEESYVLKEEPVYPVAATLDDFVTIIEQVKKDSTGKAVRQFTNDAIDIISEQLKQKYKDVEKHVVTSDQAQHVLILVDEIEISISATMLYFRNKTAISDSHYQHVKEEQKEA
jgi:hypothetical protein